MRHPQTAVSAVRVSSHPGAIVVSLVVACLVLALLVRVALLIQPIGGDPGIYAYIGQRILAGDVPYRDIFEQKPPGVLYAYAAAFRIAGASMTAVQFLDFASWLLAVPAMGILAWQLWRDRTAAALACVLGAVFINPNLQFGYKQVAQAETFIAVLTMAAMCAALIARWPREGGTFPVGEAVAGMLCGFAILFKYNAVPFAIACFVVLLSERTALWKRSAIFIAGCALPILVCFSYFWANHALGDLVDATVMYNLAYATASHPSSTAFVRDAATMTWRFATGNFTWTLGTFGIALLLWRAFQREPSGLPLVYAAAAAYMAVLINARFYPQYFLQVLPWLLVAAAFALTAISRTLSRWMPVWAALLVTCTVAAVIARHAAIPRLVDDVRAALAYASGRLPLEGYYERFGGYANGGDFSLLADYRLASFIRETTSPGDTIYIYGGEPLVLFLAQRKSASRFIWNDPFVAGAFRGKYTEEDLTRELEANKPAYIAVLRNDRNAVDPVDSIEYYQRSTVFRPYVQTHYRELGWMEDFLLFARAAR